MQYVMQLAAQLAANKMPPAAEGLGVSHCLKPEEHPQPKLPAALSPTPGKKLAANEYTT